MTPQAYLPNAEAKRAAWLAQAAGTCGPRAMAGGAPLQLVPAVQPAWGSGFCYAAKFWHLC
jgi:hypothetical protein